MQPVQPPRRSRGRVRRLARAAAAGATALLTALSIHTGPASAANRPTPGHFTGYGFDQCLAPTQAAMDAWLESSPYWAVGIYISGDSRACRSQPNLTRRWVSTQLKNGWRLLPITLGPQASCSTRFPRYGDDETIRPSSTRNYRAARRQGRAEATKAVAAAEALGIVPRSTLWYDLEAFDTGQRHCRESALRFLQAWTNRLHGLDYVSGVYSSAASGIRMLDDARVDRPHITLPDRIWIADWNGRADTDSSYIRNDGWRPGGRMHQYLGGHDETYAGVTINIDSNFIDLGRGSVPRRNVEHCGGVDVDFPSYPAIGTRSSGGLVSAAQCLLKKQGFYGGRVNGVYNRGTVDAVKEYRSARGLRVRGSVKRRVWVALLSEGGTPLLKYGAGRDAVRRVQRALNGVFRDGLAVTGTFEATTTAAVKRYQSAVGLPATGVVTDRLWRKLQSGAL